MGKRFGVLMVRVAIGLRAAYLPKFGTLGAGVPDCLADMVLIAEGEISGVTGFYPCLKILFNVNQLVRELF